MTLEAEPLLRCPKPAFMTDLFALELLQLAVKGAEALLGGTVRHSLGQGQALHLQLQDLHRAKQSAGKGALRPAQDIIALPHSRHKTTSIRALRQDLQQDLHLTLCALSDFESAPLSCIKGALCKRSLVKALMLLDSFGRSRQHCAVHVS